MTRSNGGELLTGLFPDDVQFLSEPIRDHTRALHPEESLLVASAVAKRQHEFATGRLLARKLLASFGHPDVSILKEEDRIPIWPDGIVGSISHSEGLCGAVVADAKAYAGLGLDLEPDRAVDRDIERVVCRDLEHDWVRAAGEEEHGRRCRIVFSVKEAVYKAFYPRTRTFWSFQDVTVDIDLAGETFRADLPESADRAEAEGRIQIHEGWILSGVAVPA